MIMHFTAATIASISGAVALVSASQVVGSVGYAYSGSAADSSSGSIRGAVIKSQGTECSFANGFKAQEHQTDMGILNCGTGLICVEDESSSKGGRCTTAVTGEVAKHHRQLVACTYVNGTYGVKCEGPSACNGADTAKIGCGSCIGNNACSDWTGNITVGEGSCVGTEACRSMYTTSSIVIGDGSCHDNVACKFIKGEHFFVPFEFQHIVKTHMSWIYQAM
jgi:hypothetical protein